MHVPTHLMSGWCIGNLFRISARERLMCMVAASVPDLDGLSIIGGTNAYMDYHHKICHNVPFGVVACTLLWIFSGRRFGALILYLALFHLHLVMDFFGSGPGWGIFYFWPFSQWSADNWRYSWEFTSWQNTTTAAVFLLWTIAIAIVRGRTPLEVPMANLDRQLVEWFRRRVGWKERQRPSTMSTP
jgi:inner membrane protein